MGIEFVMPFILMITVGIICLMVYMAYERRISRTMAVFISTCFLVFSGALCWRMTTVTPTVAQQLPGSGSGQSILQRQLTPPTAKHKSLVPKEYHQKASIVAEAGRRYPDKLIAETKGKKLAIDGLYLMAESGEGKDKMFALSDRPGGALTEESNVVFFCKPANDKTTRILSSASKLTPMLVVAEFIELQKVTEIKNSPTNVFLMLVYYVEPSE